MNNKEKDKIKIIGAIVFLIIVVIIMVFLFTKKDTNEIKDIVLKDSEMQLAEFLITSEEDTLNLVDNKGNVLDTIEGTNIKLRYNTDLDEFMYTNENNIYTATITSEKTEDENGAEKILGSLTEKEIYTSKDVVDDFAFNDNYIVTLTKKETVSGNEIAESSISMKPETTETKTETKTSKTEEKSKKTESKEDTKTEEDNILKQELPSLSEITIYTMNVIDRNSNKNVYTLDDGVSDVVLYNNTLVYARNNYLYSYNLETKEYKELYLGKDITTLDIANDKLIVFSTFGNEKNKTTIMQLDDTLNIEVVTTHDTPYTYAVGSDEEVIITYIDCKNKPVFYNLDLTGERETKKKLNLNIDVTENQYSYDNTVYTQGYLYTSKDNCIKIIDLKANNIYADYNIECDTVYPIFLDDKENSSEDEE